jgi:hypothetical protein
MTMQPAEVIAPDAELWATSRLRTLLAGRVEPYANDVYVSNKKPTTNRDQTVVIRRDGGPRRGVFDYPRLSVRVWCDDEQDASDLARLVLALFVVSPGDGVCVAVTNPTGPSGVPDDSQPQKYLTFEAQLRCTDL